MSVSELMLAVSIAIIMLDVLLTWWRDYLLPRWRPWMSRAVEVPAAWVVRDDLTTHPQHFNTATKSCYDYGCTDDCPVGGRKL